jgi:cyclically-permuted mutarotase family protein
MWPVGLFLLTASGIIQKTVMDWKSSPPIPPRSGMALQYGLAGPLSGADGNYLLVAGGANFESGMPWRGGPKTYHDEIFLLKDHADGSLSWEISKTKLSSPIAYSACVTTGNGFVSIGGENENGPVSNVTHYTFSDGNIRIVPLPDLPEGVSSPGATQLGNQIFVAGGLNKNGATNAFYSLSLSHSESGWEVLPALPVKLSHAVVASQNSGNGRAIFVIGGRNKAGELTSFLSSVFRYSATEGQWTKVSDIVINGQVAGLSAGTGLAEGNDRILLFGGDRGVLFNQTERLNLQIEAATNAVRKDSLLQIKEAFLAHHPGFSNQVLSYNITTGKWSEIGTLPFEPPVTTVALTWKGKIVIPSGEIRPGVRSDRVIMTNAR